MKAVLIDDEQLALDYFEHLLKEVTDLQIKGKFTDAREALEFIKNVHTDVVFLDIEMPGIDGLELADQILALEAGIKIVFVTAYEEYAVDAFELNALDYLLKPVDKARLTRTVERLVAAGMPTEQESTDIRLKLFGRVGIVKESGSSEQIKWRTAKAEQLFFYLLHSHGRTVTKDAIVELLWDDFAYKNALQQMYVTVYQIRKALEPYAGLITLESTMNGYLLRLDGVEIDVDVFERELGELKELNENTVELYEKTLNIVDGEYLEDYDYPWCEIERQRLYLLWLRGSLRVVDWYYTQGDAERTIDLALAICHRYPLEEDALLYLMKGFALAGNRLRVKETYDRLRRELSAVEIEKPGEALEEWYRNWLRNNEERSQKI